MERNPIVELLNEMSIAKAASISDLDAVRNTKPNGNHVLYQLLMTAANLETTIASYMEEIGMARFSYHKSQANLLRSEANQHIHG